MDRIASLAQSPYPLPPRAGIGLKPQHYDAILDPDKSAGRPAWVEVHPQNYFSTDGRIGGGSPHRWLSAIAENLPISFHSVGLSLGSADGLMADQLDQLAVLSDRYQPALISDHLSFSGDAHDRFADLLPIPYTIDALDHFAAQIGRVQDRLKRSILIENPSCYLAYRHSTMSETDFIAQLIERTGCGLLLDLNNVIVSTGNLGGTVGEYLENINPNWVGEIHLAGHTTELHDSGPLFIDNHGSAVSDELWDVYAQFIERAGPKPTLIEWDTDVPDYAVLIAEAAAADKLLTTERYADA
jgi:uncharacterized protein